MGIRAWMCYEASRRLLPPPAERTMSHLAYQDWRVQSLSRSFQAFSDADVDNKDVLDFGCGDGALSLHLAATKNPRRVIGVDLDQASIDRANVAKLVAPPPAGIRVDFMVGDTTTVPVPDSSIDTVVAFDCLEHIMSPLPIFQEWHRVLRPGGKCLIEWYPYKGPWGPQWSR